MKAVAAATALTASAFAQSMGEKTGVNSALGITPKTEDFIKKISSKRRPPATCWKSKLPKSPSAERLQNPDA